MKHKVGDRVRIVGNSNRHGFAIGDTVTINKAFNDGYCCEGKTGHWYLRESDCEAIPAKPTLWKDMTPEEKGALLLAHHEGKNIQFWAVDYQRWDPDTAYRVKPEPPAPKIETVVLYGDGDFFSICERWIWSHKLTYRTIDGVIDCESAVMEPIDDARTEDAG